MFGATKISSCLEFRQNIFSLHWRYCQTLQFQCFMKFKIILSLLLLPLFLAAQTTKPPKLRIEKTFFATRYELGDKTTPHKEVAQHLKVHETDAYIYWKRADQSANRELGWAVVGLLGAVVGLVSEEPENALLGWSTSAVGFGASLICNLSGNQKRQKAIDTYNVKFGY